MMKKIFVPHFAVALILFLTGSLTGASRPYSKNARLVSTMRPRPVFSNRCPRCAQGEIFRGVYAMNSRCGSCGQLFEKEPGYFMGAMIASYFIGAFSLVPTLALGLFVWKLEPLTIVALGAAQVLLLHPFLFHYSRLAWISIETRMTGVLDRGKGR